MQIYPQIRNPQLEYRRPSDWLLLPEVNPIEEKFAGLFAVYDTGSNLIALKFADDYTVDWGDGLVEDFASGATAEHSYDFGSVDSETLTAGGYKQVVVTVTPRSGFNLREMDISVRHSSYPPTSSDEFSTAWLDICISLPQGETMLLSDGTHYLGSLEISKIVTSGNCTDLSYLFNRSVSLTNFIAESLPNVEDISYMLTNCTSLSSVTLPDMPSLLALESPFYNCSSLLKVTVGDVSNPDNIDSMFYDLNSLQEVYIAKTPASLVETFSNCSSLRQVIIEDPSLITLLASTFYDCSSLQKVYFRSTPLLESCYNTFAYCYALEYVKFENLPSLTDSTFMFYECKSLSELHLPSMTSLEVSESMFGYCSSLRRVDLTGLSNLTNLSQMFYRSAGLHSVSLSDLPVGFNLNQCFYSCYSLSEVFLGGAPEDLAGSFAYCGNLRKLEIEDCSQVSTTFEAFFNCTQLSTLRIPGLTVDINLSGCLLSKNAIVQVFEDLGTVGSTEYINISGNWGESFLSSQDLEIATDKGWNVGPMPTCDSPPFFCNTSVNPYCVTDFHQAWIYCSSITNFPLIDVSSGINFSYAWSYCNNLTSFPELDVSSGINFEGAWYSCTSLTSFPLLDVSSGINFNSAWYDCTSLTSFPLLDVSSGGNFGGAWRGCTSLTSFPLLDVSSGTNFNSAWYDCTSLTSFPAGMFDNCASIEFLNAWGNCSLDQTSVDNILVSINTAGTSNGFIGMNGGTSVSPGVAGLAAKGDLEARGWTVATN